MFLPQNRVQNGIRHRLCTRGTCVEHIENMQLPLSGGLSSDHAESYRGVVAKQCGIWIEFLVRNGLFNFRRSLS